MIGRNRLLFAILATIFFLWSFWELFHCSYHICHDWTLLDLPGVKLMMVRKILFLGLSAGFLVFLLKKKKAVRA